ncbi:MAG TPA: anti-sigma factor [Dehalococcoidia bacterium]|nr:anti-sigma factor [Dehalococcoidia bacterium]
MTYLDDEKVAVLDVHLPQLAADQVSQTWYQQCSSTGMTSMGLLDSNGGRTAFSIDLSKSTAVAISAEPDGGSPAPTTPPVVVAQLN